MPSLWPIEHGGYPFPPEKDDNNHEAHASVNQWNRRRAPEREVPKHMSRESKSTRISVSHQCRALSCLAYNSSGNPPLGIYLTSIALWEWNACMKKNSFNSMTVLLSFITNFIWRGKKRIQKEHKVIVFSLQTVSCVPCPPQTPMSAAKISQKVNTETQGSAVNSSVPRAVGIKLKFLFLSPAFVAGVCSLLPVGNDSCHNYYQVNTGRRTGRREEEKKMRESKSLVAAHGEWMKNENNSKWVSSLPVPSLVNARAQTHTFACIHNVHAHIHKLRYSRGRLLHEPQHVWQSEAML